MIDWDLQWALWASIIARDYHEFMIEKYQKELDALSIVQLCLTGK
jgi:hypothetical protein